MKILSFSAALLVSALTLFSCKKDNPIPPEAQPQINLTFEDASCTEAWIKLTTSNISLPAEVMLKQDDAVTQTISLGNSDTLLYIDSLLPNHTYKFQTEIQSVNQASNSLNVRTMDTTSHNFTFETFTFGGTAGSSVLYDVAIINENDIWAVGEIYVADTSQNGYTMYNAVHWDGNEWKLKQILYGNNYWTITTIYAFSKNDIWFSAFVRFDGQNFTEMDIPVIMMGWRVNKLWGTSSSDMYVVGNNGNIAHYDGQSWTKIESETELSINDIYGAYNEKTNKWEVLAVAANVLESLDRDLLSINGNSAHLLNTSPLIGTLSSLWFIPNKRYYICGGGLYQKQLLNDTLWGNGPLEFTNYYTHRIKGVSITDIAAAGGAGEVIHYNGSSWKSFIDQTVLPSGNYYGLDYKDNIIVAVGINNPAAVITIGKRNN